MDNFDGPYHYYQFLLWLFKEIPHPSPNMIRLPRELQEHIIEYVLDADDDMADTVTPPQPSRSLPSIPPRNGASPFMDLPTELRRQIFADSLPQRAVFHHPKCGKAGCVESKKGSSKEDSSKRPQPARRNRISDLMTLNKKICAEIAEVVYEERFFVIHVHEGLGGEGGIEFLNAGRQPLQYQDCTEDERFYKFKKGDEFGFRRLKKIIIQIHPAPEDNCRHTAINTHFINLALCRLLDREGAEKNRITSLKIEFPKRKSNGTAVGRRAIQHEQYWWDPDKQKPRETSIEFLSNIELVLRPFEILTGCHSVIIELPENVRNHQRTTKFVEQLKSSMMSEYRSMFADDDLEMKIETARQPMEDYVNYTLHGNGYHEVPNVTEAEMQEDLMDVDNDIISISSDDDDDILGGRKHGLSPASKLEAGDWKRRPGQTRSEWKDEQRMMLESHLSVQEEEDRLYAAAIAASMEDAVPHRGCREQTPSSGYPIYEPKVQTNGQRNGSYASALKGPAPDNSSFKGPGRTLASTGVSKGNSQQVLRDGLARTPMFPLAKGDFSTKQATGWNVDKAPSALRPAAASFSPPDGNMIARNQVPASYLGGPGNMPRLPGTDAPQSEFSQSGQAGLTQTLRGVPRKTSSVEALRARYVGIPPNSNASATPSTIGGRISKVKPSQSQLDPTAPKFEGSGRRRSVILSAQIVGRTAKGEDITVTEDGEITYVERR